MATAPNAVNVTYLVRPVVWEFFALNRCSTHQHQAHPVRVPIVRLACVEALCSRTTRENYRYFTREMWHVVLTVVLFRVCFSLQLLAQNLALVLAG